MYKGQHCHENLRVEFQQSIECSCSSGYGWCEDEPVETIQQLSKPWFHASTMTRMDSMYHLLIYQEHHIESIRFLKTKSSLFVREINALIVPFL